jgi:hypothetical protein
MADLLKPASYNSQASTISVYFCTATVCSFNSRLLESYGEYYAHLKLLSRCVIFYGCMAGVAQWLERLVVAQEAGGSTPLTRPKPLHFHALLSSANQVECAVSVANI